MNKTERHPQTNCLRIVAAAMLLAWLSQAAGQTFNSGSTESLGDVTATSTPIVLPPDGVLNYRTFTVPAGVVVTFQRNAANTPVTLLASGDVTINGTISVNGSPGGNGSASGTVPGQGGLGGPGGFRGGNGGLAGVSFTSGQGPGGGVTAESTAQASFPAGVPHTLIPLFGGSGGAGANVTTGSGPGGGGGGGAIVIASSSKITIASTGAITANRAAGGTVNNAGGPGSGGAIRLVAPQITGSGSLQVNGDFASTGGRIRLEAFSQNFTGTFSPNTTATMLQSMTPGPVHAGSTPALVALPTLAITSVGGIAAPAVPGGSYTTADVSVAPGSGSVQPVIVTATNTPTSAAVTVALIPQTGSRSTTPPLTLTGSFASSSLTAGITFPLGSVSLVQAWATMTLSGQIASLFPLIDGEPVEQVAVASEPAVLKLITASGRERRLDELDAADRLKVAQAWQLVKEMQQ